MVTMRPTQRPRRRTESRGGGRFNYVTVRRGQKLLNQQAQKYLKMSGTEFAQKYRAGEIQDPDRSEVIRVAMLLPLANK